MAAIKPGLRVTVGVADHQITCRVVDFTMHAVSVHIPMTRFLAALYALMRDDRPDVISHVFYPSVCAFFSSSIVPTC